MMSKNAAIKYILSAEAGDISRLKNIKMESLFSKLVSEFAKSTVTVQMGSKVSQFEAGNLNILVYITIFASRIG